MKVRDIMVTTLITTGPEANLKTVADLMIQHNVGAIPVVDQSNELLGIITETDFMPKERDLPFSSFRLPYLFGEVISREGMERFYAEASTRSVQEVMSPYVATATEDEAVTSVVQKMLENNVKHVPIVRDKKLVGIVTRHDLLRLLSQQPQ